MCHYSPYSMCVRYSLLKIHDHGVLAIFLFFSPIISGTSMTKCLLDTKHLPSPSTAKMNVISD